MQKSMSSFDVLATLSTPMIYVSYLFVPYKMRKFPEKLPGYIYVIMPPISSGQINRSLISPGKGLPYTIYT